MVEPEGKGATLTKHLIMISKQVRVILRLRLAPFGLSVGLDEYLLALDESIPQSIYAVAQKLSVNPSTVSKMTDKLDQLGLVMRYPSKVDQRTTFVRITPKGLEVCSKVRLAYEAVEVELQEYLDGDVTSPVQHLKNLENALRHTILQLR